MHKEIEEENERKMGSKKEQKISLCFLEVDSGIDYNVKVPANCTTDELLALIKEHTLESILVGVEYN